MILLDFLYVHMLEIYRFVCLFVSTQTALANTGKFILMFSVNERDSDLDGFGITVGMKQ